MCYFDFFFIKVELCNECIEWAKEEKRTFLRQALEVHDATKKRNRIYIN